MTRKCRDSCIHVLKHAALWQFLENDCTEMVIRRVRDITLTTLPNNTLIKNNNFGILCCTLFYIGFTQGDNKLWLVVDVLIFKTY